MTFFDMHLTLFEAGHRRPVEEAKGAKGWPVCPDPAGVPDVDDTFDCPACTGALASVASVKTRAGGPVRHARRTSSR